MSEWNQPPQPLTREEFRAAVGPQHGSQCACPLCNMDRGVASEAECALFGEEKPTVGSEA
jgi:hypothetical protein